jgi:hypothetical protein
MKAYRRFIRMSALLATSAGFLGSASVAAAQPIDTPLPASHQATTTTIVDQRTPDARAAGQITREAAVTSSVPQNLRSPDAVDQSRSPLAPPTTVRVVDNSGFEWGDAGIGGGVVFAIAAFGLGAGVLMRRRQRPGGPSLPAVHA